MNAKFYKVTCHQGVSIWDQGSGWSLRPWPGDTEATIGWDDGGCDYSLPSGYQVSEDRGGLPRIYDAEGRDVVICGGTAPELVDNATGSIIPLKRAPRGR